MVNSRNVAFKVDKQTLVEGPPPPAVGTVINCRKRSGKRHPKELGEVKSQEVPLPKIGGGSQPKKRKRKEEDEVPDDASASQEDPVLAHEQNSLRPTKFRRGKSLSKGIDLDCWFTILSFSDPAQLLVMRSKIASCYRFLRDNPSLWKHSRTYYYNGTLPDPPQDLTEFQYADLRHGHGCMSCGTPTTRKAYWAFLRRWCKTCLQSKTIKEIDALALLKDANGEDISFIQKCLPAGIFDSWGNFVGVGPASAQSLKTVYLLSDVQKLVADFIKESRDNYVSWHAEMRTWISNKVKVVDQRREFARKMELWEEISRTSRAFLYREKKQDRKKYFAHKASQLTPPISQREMEYCPSYRRAVAIPKEPNLTSWLQLKPKLEKEVADLKIKASPSRSGYPLYGSSGASTPSSDFYRS